MIQCFLTGSQPGIDTGYTDTQIRMQRYHLTGICEIKVLSHTCHDHHREFQTFTVMDTHDAHHIRVFSAGLSFAKVHFIFFQTVNITDKMKQSAVACFFIFRRFLDQHQQIGSSLLPCRHGCDLIQISGFFIQAGQKFPHCNVRGFFTKFFVC